MDPTSLAEKPGVTAIDPPPPSNDGPTPHHLTHSHRNAQFAQIGRTLSICECSEFRVAIPILPPTATVRRYRDARDEPQLDSFLRLSLVEIPTELLLSYDDELQRSFGSRRIDSDLALFAPTAFERHYFAASLFALGLAVCILTGAAIGIPVPAAGLAGILIGGVLSMVGGTFSSDDHRLNSFSATLNREICRRGGIDPESSANLRICVTS